MSESAQCFDVLETKPGARTLDATAGNRKFWRIDDNPNIIYIDVDDELEITPDLVIDCTNTGFPNKYFFTIIYDPPHSWGGKTGNEFYTCRNQHEWDALIERYGFKRKSLPTYYGTDKFRSKTELLSFIYESQIEFNRILAPNGILWLNWSELKMPLTDVLPLFRDWDELIRLEIGSRRQTLSDHQNYWIMFMKKSRPDPQTALNQFTVVRHR